MAIEGVDYSQSYPGPAALKDAGKFFVVRYLADDWRGLSVPEIDELTAGGVDIAVVYESTEGRALDGELAGIFDATYAQNKLVQLGLSQTMPIYFAVDCDAAPDDQAAIDAYLGGAAQVIGAERVGVYGGYWVVSRCAANGSAKWYWQTTAWSGGNFFDGNHLYQYAYNLWINNVNCDATQALQDNYGQASKFSGVPVPPIPPPTTKPPKPSKYAKPNPITRGSDTVFAYGKKLTVIKEYQPRQVASVNGKPTAGVFKVGATVRVKWLMVARDGTAWFVTAGGSRHPAWAFFSPIGEKA